MKYKSKKISYEGCHPIIAEHLQRGGAVWCKVWDADKNRQQQTFIGAFVGGRLHQYRSSSDGTGWQHAEPIPTIIKRIMPAERAIPVLIAGGWRFDSKGDLIHQSEINVSSYCFCYFGQGVESANLNLDYWPACIIEDVDE